MGFRLLPAARAISSHRRLVCDRPDHRLMAIFFRPAGASSPYLTVSEIFR
jgi:hypothetical protein